MENSTIASFSSFSIQMDSNTTSLLPHTETVKNLNFLWLFRPIKVCCGVVPLRLSLFLLGGLFIAGAFANAFCSFLRGKIQLVFLSFSGVVGDYEVVMWIDFVWWILTACASIYSGFRPFTLATRMCVSLCCSIEVFCGAFKAVLGLISLIRMLIFAFKESGLEIQEDLREATILLLAGSVISFHMAHVYWSYREVHMNDSNPNSVASFGESSPLPHTFGRTEHKDCSRRGSFFSKQVA
eukprot:GHVS01070946.1.p1 GENE.GHVS01070946.1~~GHVS01070946.1.p1  ORF type:complete len:239 (-),score=20.95 GHVS01070946.1:234-950(-)